MKNNNIYYSETYLPLDPEIQSPTSQIQGSGGGGSCFPKATLVKTFKGFKPIETISVGEKVISYDRVGNLNLGIVSEVHTHKVDSKTPKLCFFYSGEECLFPEGVTGNHALYDPKTNEHKLADSFKIGDSVETLKKEKKKLTRINRVDCLEKFVYNLTVEPQHTFTVNGIKVHNGGGGKDGGRSAREAPNTLQSSAVANILEVISHGEIVGVIGSKKGVFFNSTPMQNSDLSENFPGSSFEERTGLPSQLPIKGFDKVEGELSVPSTKVTTTGVVIDLVNSNIDLARVTLKLPKGLWRQDKTTGDLLGHTIGYTIYTRELPLGTFSTVLTKTLTDKTRSPWEIAHLIEAPIGATQWSIKIVRNSPEDTTADKESELVWERLTEIIDSKLSYDNVAYVGLSIPAETTGNSIPTRAYNVMGIKLKIPVNYDPVLRNYGSSYWNGVFKTAWSDNPAWVLYDLITNPEYGMANFLNQPIDVDIYSFYEASLYCDAVTWSPLTQTYTTSLLDDGQGGLEVRYIFNAVIQTQSSAWQLLHAVASNMRAVLIMKGSQIALLQDRPKAPVKIINTSNVLGGVFSYSSSSATTRITSVNVTFNDKLDRYLPRTVSEENVAGIALYGLTVKEISAYGATTESQARRMGKWMLYSEANQTDLVSFSLALNIIDLEVGDVVSIMDHHYISDVNAYLSGRVISLSGTSVTLDRPVTIESGYTYNFGVMSLDYSTIEETIITSPPGVQDTLTLNTSLPPGDYSSHEFFCFSEGHIEPREFLITSIKETDKGIYAIEALFYDVDKYAFIEQGITIPVTNYSNLISTVVPAVTNITFSELFLNSGIASENSILVKWDWETSVDGIDQVIYNLRWRRDTGRYTLVNNIPLKEFQIPSIIPGVYDVIVEARNLQGKSSLSTFSTYNYRTSQADSTLNPPENFYVKGTGATAFTGVHIPVEWTFPISNELKSDVLLDYKLEAWTPNGLTLLSSHIISPTGSLGGSFDYTLEQNTNDFGNPPSRDVQFRLYSRDAVGEFSLPTTGNFTNQSPGIVSFSLSSGSESTYIDIVAPTDIDLKGFIVYRNLTSGFTPQESDMVYRGSNNYISLKGSSGVTYYYRVAAYDTFGEDSLQLSSEQSSTVLSTTLDTWTFDGLIFKPNDPNANEISWTAGTVSKNGGTPVSIIAGSTAFTSGVRFVYYSGTGGALSTTNDLGIAVGGVQILAAYKGGTSVQLDNSTAFVDGNLVLANTIGANQLVVDTAIITNALQVASAIIKQTHIDVAAIGNAQIKDFIQSSNWSTINKTGWKVDKTGNITTYGALSILAEGTGEVVLQTGAQAALAWNKLFNRPTDTQLLNVNTTPADIGYTGDLNATNGADFPTNVSNIPIELEDGRIVTALDNSGFLKSGLNSVIDVATLMDSLNGINISKNPEFLGGITNIVVYNNLGGSAVTHTIITDDTAPNSSGYVLRYSFDGIGASSPGFGGLLQAINYAGNGNPLKPKTYVQNSKIVYKIVAKVPIGRIIEQTSNATGNGGGFAWLTSQAGTGDWYTYIGVRTIGVGGTLLGTGHIYFTGGAATAFTVDIAKYEQTVLDASRSTFVETSFRDSNGNGLLDTAIKNDTITINANGSLSNAGGGQVLVASLSDSGTLATKNTADYGSDISGTKPPSDANNTTNTNQLTDGAGLGNTAVWGAATITGQPSDTQLLNSNTTPGDIGYIGDLNATNGADYPTNISNKPTSLNDINAGEFDVIASQNSNSFIAGNIIPNGNMTLVAPDGRPLGAKACFGSTDPSIIKYADLNKTILNLHSAVDNTVGVCFPAFIVNVDTSYKIIIRVKSNVASIAGFYFRIQELDSELNVGNTHTVLGIGEPGVQMATRNVLLGNEDVSITTSWVVKELIYTPTSSAKWASPMFLNWTGMVFSELHIDRVVIYDQSTKGATWSVDVTGQPSDTVLLNSNTTPADIGYTGDLDANKITNTNQLSDGANLGGTAVWTSVASRPTNLTGLNSTEGSKLIGIQAGATVGADFNSNLANKPTTLANINSSEGTKLTGIAAGADVTSYVDSRIANALNENNLLTIAKPVGASYSSNSSSTTGVIKITLPQSWTNTMLRFTIEVFLYQTGRSFSLEVSGDTFTSGAVWLNMSANLFGSIASDNRVRFGHDGTNCCIYIGDTNTIWNSPKVAVKNFQAGFSNFSVAQWETGWNISVETSVGTISPVGDFADALIDAKAIKNQGALATKSTVDLATTDVTNKSLANVDPTANSKLITIQPNADVTANNTAQAIAGQGAFATVSQITAANRATFLELALISEAYIKDLSVSTIKVKGSIVTLEVVSVAATKSTTSTFSDIFTNVITVDQNGDGRILIEFSALKAQANAYALTTTANGLTVGSVGWVWLCEIRILKDGVVLETYLSLGGEIISMVLEDTVSVIGNPSYTYTLQARWSYKWPAAETNPRILNSVFIVKQIKK